MSCNPWKLTSLLYPLVIAALLPLTLAEVIDALPHIILRLRRTEAHDRRTQREIFRRRPFIPDEKLAA